MAVLDQALIVSTVGGLQVEHVHCCPVFAVHLSVAPRFRWYFVQRMKTIDKVVIPLKVEEFDVFGVIHRAAKGQISTNFPLKVNIHMSSSIWKKTQGTKSENDGKIKKIKKKDDCIGKKPLIWLFTGRLKVARLDSPN